MVTLQTADGALKEFYLDAIKKELDEKISPFFSMIEKTSTNVVGKNVNKVVKTGVHGSIGAGSETGDLPYGDSTNSLTLKASLKNLYGTIQISDKAIRASANNEGALVNLLNEEMQELVESAKYNFSRMLFGDGNGTVAIVSASEGVNKIYVEDSHSIEEGMRVDIYEHGQKSIPNVKIINVNKESNCIELEGVNWVDDGLLDADSKLVFHGVEPEYELTGLQALFSQQDIYEQDRSTEYMRPLISVADGAFELNRLDELIDKAEERSGSKINLIFCSWKVKRYILRLARENNIAIGTTTMGDNMVVPTYNGIPLVVDRFCPDSAIYLLNTNDFKICQLCDWQWMEGEDGKILKQVPGKPVYTATLVKYAELLCEKPCGQAAIVGIEF